MVHFGVNAFSNCKYMLFIGINRAGETKHRVSQDVIMLNECRATVDHWPVDLTCYQNTDCQGKVLEMDGIEPIVLTEVAIELMTEALTLLDRANAWEASAHLDLAIRRLEAWDFDRQNMADEA